MNVFRCNNIKYTENKSNSRPTFSGYKCDNERNVIYSTKYFAKKSDSSFIYVTYLPVGCYDKTSKVPKISISKLETYYSKQIKDISKESTETNEKRVIRLDF